MDISCIFETYFVPIVPLLAAYLVYRLGKYSYFQQKEYELVVKRYIEEGIDTISENIDRSLAIFRHNWWHTTVVIKNFRDLGSGMNRELYQKGLIEPNPGNFHFWRDYRLQDIVGSKIFNITNQSLDAFLKTSYATLKDDVCHGIRISVEGAEGLQVTASTDQIVDTLFPVVNKLNEDSYRYYKLLAILQNLSSIIQTERLDFKDLKMLRHRKDVSQNVKMLEQLFEEEMKDDTST
ncbi:MAG: hypothetical protein P8179_22565 [Candidatus Thiodiazotropha sp.]|jgi:hypothetical protein